MNVAKAVFFKFILIAALFAALPAVGLAQTSAASQVSEFEVNGLKVLIKRRPSSPTVAGGLFVKGGAANLTDRTQGIENLMVTSAVEAGSKFSRQTVRRELSRTGSNIAASSGKDFGVYSVTTTRPNFDRIWEIFANVVMEPAFAEEDVARNRSLMLAQLRESETSPESALQVSLDRIIFSGQPYGLRPEGTITTVNSLTPADLRAHHKKVMQTSQLLLVLVGDLDPTVMRERIAATFGKLPRGTYQSKPLPAADFSKPTIDVVQRANLPTNYIEGVFAAPTPGEPDYYAMRIATAVLQSLVYQEVRVNRQLSYAPGAEMSTDARNTANISVTSTDANQSVQVMLDQIALLRERTLRDDVISEIADNFLTTYYLNQETSVAQARELAIYELYGGGWRNSFEFLDRMRKVTGRDVNAAAVKYMKNIRFVVLGNPEAVDRKIFLRQF